MVKRVGAFRQYTNNQDTMHPPARELGATPIAPDLDLPEGASISRTALILPPDLSIDTWVQLGSKFGTFEYGIQWWVGDWWHYGAHSYGARKAKLAAKPSFPYSFATCCNWGWVSGKVATSLRNEVLSWSHHYAVAPYEPDEQVKWLNKAVENRWPVWMLRRAVQEDAWARSEQEKLYDRAILYSARLEQHIHCTYGMIAFAGINAKLLSHLHAYEPRELADKCDETSKWWANARDELRVLADANADWEDRMNAQWEAEHGQEEAAE